MYFQFLFIVVIICLYLISINIFNEPEQFDARISGTNVETCGSICSSIAGCSGFAFDNKTNKCYISKYPLIQQPIYGLYTDEYNTQQFRCSKMFPIKEENGLSKISNIDKINNTLYSCANKEKDRMTLKKIIGDKIVDFSMNEIDKIPYEDYEIDYIKWPVNKKDLQIENILENNAEALKKVHVFDKNKDEFLGQYLYPYRCVDNISEKECLDVCVNNKDCVGVEWNPLMLTKDDKDGTYKMRTNICCPKKLIDEVVTRRDEFKNGFFYEKKLVNRFNKDINYYVSINKKN